MHNISISRRSLLAALSFTAISFALGGCSSKSSGAVSAPTTQNANSGTGDSSNASLKSYLSQNGERSTFDFEKYLLDKGFTSEDIHLDGQYMTIDSIAGGNYIQTFITNNGNYVHLVYQYTDEKNLELLGNKTGESKVSGVEYVAISGYYKPTSSDLIKMLYPHTDKNGANIESFGLLPFSAIEMIDAALSSEKQGSTSNPWSESETYSICGTGGFDFYKNNGYIHMYSYGSQGDESLGNHFSV